MWSESEFGKQRGAARSPGGSEGLDLQDLSDLIGTIYDCALTPARWKEVVAAICQRCNYESGVLALLSLRGLTHPVCIYHNYDDAWIAAGDRYVEDTVNMWGGPARVQSYPLDEPIVASSVMPVTEWEKFAVWRDINVPRGIIDATVVGVARQPDLVGYIGLNRYSANGPVRDADIEELRLIAPHVRRAVTIGNLFDLRTVEVETFRSVLDAMSRAVILVDEELRVVHANTVAENMLAAGTLLSAVQGRLSVRGRFGQDALRAAVTAAAQNESILGQRGIGIPATADDGATAVLHLLPLTRGEVRAGLSPRAVAAIFAVADGAHAPVDGIAALYDLTPAESQIFASLVQGASLEETAAGLGIAKSTARTHLLHIFAKTGCSRQAELVALASRLSLKL